MSFITINNRNNFLIGEIPSLHPQSMDYRRYWRLHKRRCIEGFWSIDSQEVKCSIDHKEPKESHKGSWRYMPSNLYFYCNFGVIELNDDNDEETAPKILARPHLRDFEWEFFYNWAEARGFSGFEDDKEFTCDRRVSALEKLEAQKFNMDIKKYRKKETRIKKRLREFNYKKDGTLKTYVPAREYLRQLFDKPLGKAMYSNEARDILLLGARGGGKSYLVGVGVLLHEFLFDGVKTYTLGAKAPRAQLCIGAALTSKSSEILEKFKIAHDNLSGDFAPGTYDYKPAPFKKKTSGTLEPNNVKNPYRWEYEAKKGRERSKKGSGTSLKHVCYKDNSEAAAGGRYSVHAIEEIGLLDNALTVHGSNEATMMKDGTVKFGSAVYIGTGGNVEKIQETEILFRDPGGFNILPFDDEWEGTGQVGWFVPAYYMDGNYKDELGNTDVESALEHYKDRREEKRKATDQSALSLEMMNYPLVPSEMFLNAHGSMFPQAELKARLAELRANPHKYQNAHWYGELVFKSDGTLKWTNTNATQVVREFPIKNNKDKPGVIEIFEMPKKTASGEVYKNRYLQGTDTYDDDESQTNSLGSTFILDMWTNRIVAEYTGRRGASEFYEITRKLNIFYKTTHNYEQNKKGLYSYYDIKKSTHLLCDTPESLKDVADITISKVGNRRKGTVASAPINAHGLRLILDWLLEPAYGEEEGSEILNLHTISSEGLLQELMNFHPKNGNFDRVSAMIMVMIIKEDKTLTFEKTQVEKVETLANDDFFKRNYKK